MFPRLYTCHPVKSFALKNALESEVSGLSFTVVDWLQEAKAKDRISAMDLIGLVDIVVDF